MITYLKNGLGLEKTGKWTPGCWINIECPTDSDSDYVINELKVPASFYNDIADIDERAHIEYEEGWTLIIIRIPHKNGDTSLPYNTIPLGIMIKDDIFVTVCHYNTEMISDFISYTGRKNINYSNNLDLVLKLLLSSCVWFLKNLKQINIKIKAAEKHLEKSIKNEELQALLQIEKCLVFYITSLKGNDILLYKLKSIKNRTSEIDLELVEDVEIELKQALETANIYSDILSGMMDAYASVISNNLNVIMKQLTSISIILMIPTLIASLYGMNVPNFFEDNHFGFWIILLISFLFSGFGVFLFKRRNWF